MNYLYKLNILADIFTDKILKYSRTNAKEKVIKLLENGIKDSQLDYLRDGMRNMDPFYNAYRLGIDMGLTPNQIATGKPYNINGESFPPITIEIEDSGKMYLHDGRHRYKAARKFEADKILAKIRQYDSEGNTISEVIKIVKLI